MLHKQQKQTYQLKQTNLVFADIACFTDILPYMYGIIQDMNWLHISALHQYTNLNALTTIIILVEGFALWMLHCFGKYCGFEKP